MNHQRPSPSTVQVLLSRLSHGQRQDVLSEFPQICRSSRLGFPSVIAEKVRHIDIEKQVVKAIRKYVKDNKIKLT